MINVFLEGVIISNVPTLTLSWTILLVGIFLLSGYCALKIFGDEETENA
jgi:hypothetical protein